LLHQFRAGEAAVAANGYVRFVLGQALGADGATEPISGFSVQKFRDSAANVIGAEDAVGEFGYELGWAAHYWKCSILKVAGPGGEILVGRLKLKGMTAFSTESSWCEKAMTPTPASI
jgi:hypothetical protein